MDVGNVDWKQGQCKGANGKRKGGYFKGFNGKAKGTKRARTKERRKPSHQNDNSHIITMSPKDTAENLEHLGTHGQVVTLEREATPQQ